MSIIQGSSISASSTESGSADFYEYPIEQSLRFDGSSHFSRTPASPDSLRWTVSLWLKRSALGSLQTIFSGYDGVGTNDTTGGYTMLRFDSNDKITFLARNYSIFTTDSEYRDTSAWYHIVLVFNSSSSSALLYVNSVLQTTTSPSTSYIDSANSWNSGATSGITNQIGSFNSGNKLNGYIAEFNNIDGQALDASYFGEISQDIWVPKTFDGTSSTGGSTVSTNYGTNGFHLDFSTFDTRLPITMPVSGVVHDTSQQKIGSSSIYFNNSGYLKVNDHAKIDAMSGTNDWTYEFWFNNKDSSVNNGYQYAMFNGTMPDANNSQCEFHKQSGLNYECRIATSVGIQTLSSNAHADNQWHHAAMCRDSTGIRLYINGYLEDEVLGNFSVHNTSSGLHFGYRPYDGYKWYGWLDEIRLSTVARYTSNFTPQTTPFTKDNYTALLIHSDNANGSTTFVDSAGAPAGIGTDVSGNENHWTVN